MTEISKTGYWASETAHIHHVHSKPLAEWISAFLFVDRNKPVYDLGCGLGEYLHYLDSTGYERLVGFEGKIPEKAVFNNILEHDLCSPIFAPLPKGNVICLEVGEHIPAKYTEIFLDNIDKLCSDYLILSWAVRGQEGFGHVNCFDNNEVIDMFIKRGYELQYKASVDARHIIDDTTPWFKNTILIFKKT